MGIPNNVNCSAGPILGDDGFASLRGAVSDAIGAVGFVVVVVIDIDGKHTQFEQKVSSGPDRR